MSEHESSDAELLRRTARGDERAFETLYFRHRDAVLRMARRFARDEASALDAAQEAFMYLVRRAGSITLTARLTTLLYPVVKHAALRRNGLEDRALGQGMGIGDRASGRGHEESDSSLLAALGAISDEHREVLLMKVVDGMTFEEIGLALGIPVGTAKSRLHNALATLRQDECCRGYFLG